MYFKSCAWQGQAFASEFENSPRKFSRELLLRVLRIAGRDRFLSWQWRIYEIAARRLILGLPPQFNALKAAKT